MDVNIYLDMQLIVMPGPYVSDITVYANILAVYNIYRFMNIEVVMILQLQKYQEYSMGRQPILLLFVKYEIPTSKAIFVVFMTLVGSTPYKDKYW